MKAVVVMDSFKGSMDSVTAGNAAKRGILDVYPDAEVVVLPVADGGEGTADALISGLHGERVTVDVTGPLGEKVPTSYGRIGELAVMEMAQAAGLTLVPEDRRDPRNTTTFGVGEMILDAVNKGARSFIIGIGGSATNDCGLGMLTALGVEFDKYGEKAGIFGRDLEGITRIDTSKLDPRLKSCRFRIACDVKNPLFGENGASYIFAPQKGADPEAVKWFDAVHRSFAEIAGMENAEKPGAGAAGGLGFAFSTFLNASLEPGIDIILDAVGLEKELRDADIAITGEGRIDAQTAMGKAPDGIAARAKKYGVKVIAFCGTITREADIAKFENIDTCFPILRNPCTLSEAMDPQKAQDNMYRTAKQCFSLIKACGIH